MYIYEAFAEIHEYYYMRALKNSTSLQVP